MHHPRGLPGRYQTGIPARPGTREPAHQLALRAEHRQQECGVAQGGEFGGDAWCGCAGDGE